MTPQRRHELDTYQGVFLNREERTHGYHFCCDWDYMVIGPRDLEWKCCTCDKERVFKYADK